MGRTHVGPTYLHLTGFSCSPPCIFSAPDSISDLPWCRGHFKLVEERRLVAETDRLRRSRRSLGDFHRQREELEALRGGQKVRLLYCYI